MSQITAKVIADSKNEFGNRITTMVVTFPRIILAEFNTHRMFSRNSASSRAIPFEKMLKSVQENPFIPIAWQKDHKGMQGTEYFTDPEVHIHNWLMARDSAVGAVGFLAANDVTKQLCNRLLEPFMWHTVIITATELENFFALRCPKYHSGAVGEPIFRSRKDYAKHYNFEQAGHTGYSDLKWLEMNTGQAEIHAMALAEAMWDAYNESTPKELKAGKWHIPFVEIDEESMLADEELIKIATARCARVSYTVVGEEGKVANYENDAKLHDRLAESGHWSPFEHCARAMNRDEMVSHIHGNVPIEQATEHLKVHEIDSSHVESYGWSGNFKGFIQYRKTFLNENITQK